MLYSGLGLHKSTVSIHTLDAAGALIRKADLPAHGGDINAYFAWSMVSPQFAPPTLTFHQFKFLCVVNPLVSWTRRRPSFFELLDWRRRVGAAVGAGEPIERDDARR